MKRSVCVGIVALLAACGGKSKNDDAPDTSEDIAVEDSAEMQDVLDEDAADAAPDAEGALWLDLGEVVDLEGTAGSFTVDLEGPAEGGSYAVVLMASHWAPGGSYTFTSSVTAGSGGSVDTPELPPVGTDVVTRHGGPVYDRARLLDWASSNYVPYWETWPSDAPPVLDEVRGFQIQNASYAIVDIDAQCLLVNEEAAFWADITHTTATVVENLDEIARLYSEIVLVRDREFFGEESDYNGDGIIHVLFSPYVEEVGATAYFHPCDLFEDPSPSIGCNYGNHAEMVYYTSPNLLPSMMTQPTGIAETLAHETCHLIHFHRKFLLNEMPTVRENVYWTEGLAALAQDLSGFTGGNFFVTQAGLEGIETYSALNMLLSSLGYHASYDGYLRGQSYLLMRYMYDQNGGDEVQSDGTFVDPGGIAWLNEFVDSANTGAANLEASMGGVETNEILFDWFTAMLMSNRGLDSAPISDVPEYNYLPTAVDPLTDRTRGADMFGSFRGMMFLTGPTLATIDANDGVVNSAGVQYLTFDASGEVTLTIDVDETAQPWLRLARID